jgi:minor extracellular serine protease Vpr
MRGTRKLGPAFLVAAMALALAGPASAGSGGPVEPDRPAPWEMDGPSGAEIAEDLWFVEFAAAPRARGGSAAAQANERSRFASEARVNGASYEQRYDFDELWNGLSVRADQASIEVIRQLDSVQRVFPVAVIEAPQPEEVSPAMASALAMTGADNAQSELHLSGEGLSVAIIDTGIDYNHPDLGGDGNDGKRYTATSRDVRVLTDEAGNAHPRITHGWDYVGTEFNPADPSAPTDPAPNPDPRDTQGHGTHVAGIAGADAADEDGVTGVAPGVTFGAYKVFGPGSTTAEVIVDALEDAFLDGMDIVNMSLGAAFVWGQEYPTTRVSNELANQGVVVVNSAGNSGGDGLWTLSAPANAHDIISVASADNTSQMTNVFEVEQLDDPVPYLPMSNAPAPPTEDTSDEVVYIGRACSPEPGYTDDLDPLLDDPDGKVALIVRGTCTFNNKYQRAVEAGATGVVMHNNAPGLFAGGGIEPTGDVWAAAISQGSGLAIRDLLDDEETVELEFTHERVATANPTGGLASSFTSYGQDVQLEFGPSVMAPGGLIVSAYPLGSGGYAMLSGTSMAAPHVAGAVALLLEAEPDLDPFEVRDRLQNTAEPTEWSLAPGAGFLEHTFRQGAGMIRVDRAIAADQFATPAQLSLRDADSVSTTLTLTNRGDEDVTFEVGHRGALSAAIDTYDPFFYLPGSSLSGPEDVTVPAGSTADVSVTITAPVTSLPNYQYGGYVTFTPTDSSEVDTLRVPYSGYAGDYAGEMGLLGYWNADDGLQFVEVDPRLARIGEDGLEPVDEGHTYTLRQGDIPVVEAFFGHFPHEMELWAVKVDDGERFLVQEETYLRRSPQPGFFWPFGWSGMTATGSGGNLRPVPSGTYVFEMNLLRAMGDPDNEEHWDRWTSPEFRVDSRVGSSPNRGGPPPARGPGR